MLTNREIIEQAFDRLDPEREFRESVILLLASKLAPEYTPTQSDIGSVNQSDQKDGAE